jgi:hypothetical protein
MVLVPYVLRLTVVVVPVIVLTLPGTTVLVPVLLTNYCLIYRQYVSAASTAYNLRI